MAQVLMTTLGQSWQIIPELVGWTNPELVDLYRHHPQRRELDDLSPLCQESCRLGEFADTGRKRRR